MTERKDQLVTVESNLSRERRLRAEALQRRQEAAEADPEAKAARLTETERKRLADAYALVQQAEAAVSRIAFRRRDLQRITRKVEQGTVNAATGFMRIISAPRDAVAASAAERELSTLPVHLQAARDILQGRVRELRRIEAEVNAARRQRRIAAAFKSQPKPPKPHPVGDPWSTVLGREFGS